MPLSTEDRQTIITNVIQPMASDGLRTMCIAYKDYVVGTPGELFPDRIQVLQSLSFIS